MYCFSLLVIVLTTKHCNIVKYVSKLKIIPLLKLNYQVLGIIFSAC